MVPTPVETPSLFTGLSTITWQQSTQSGLHDLDAAPRIELIHITYQSGNIAWLVWRSLGLCPSHISSRPGQAPTRIRTRAYNFLRKLGVENSSGLKPLGQAASSYILLIRNMTFVQLAWLEIDRKGSTDAIFRKLEKIFFQAMY